MQKRLTQEQLIGKYGHPTLRKSQAKIITLNLLTGDYITDTLVQTTAHVSVAPRFVDAYWKVCRDLSEYPDEVQSHNVRFIAGTNRWSLHAWSLAWDVFDSRSIRIDPVTGRGIPSVEWFDRMAKEIGGVAGQRFRKPDPHHLEFPF